MSEGKTVAIRPAANLPALAMSEQELIGVLGASLYPSATIESIKMVLGYCKASGLDVMQKPVHIVPMWDKKAGAMRDVIMPGIGLYRVQAARSGQLAGVTEPEFGQDVTEEVGGTRITYPSFCKISVMRRLPTGEIGVFTAVERWRENYATAKKDVLTPNAMWSRRPYAQLAKCAEAQALRKAFPEIGAQPTADEMEGRDLSGDAIEGEVVTAAAAIQMPRAKNAPIEQPGQSATPAEPAAKPAGSGLSANQVTELRKRLTDAKLTEKELLVAHELEGEVLAEGMAVEAKTLAAWIRKRAAETAA